MCEAERLQACFVGLSDVCGGGYSEGKRLVVPQVVPETEHQKRRYEDAGRRREMRGERDCCGKRDACGVGGWSGMFDRSGCKF